MCSCVRLLPCIVLVVKFILVAACGCDLFILVAVLCDRHNLSALLPVEHLVYFQYLAVMSIVALNILIHVLLYERTCCVTG